MQERQEGQFARISIIGLISHRKIKNGETIEEEGVRAGTERGGEVVPHESSKKIKR